MLSDFDGYSRNIFACSKVVERDLWLVFFFRLEGGDLSFEPILNIPSFPHVSFYKILKDI